MIRVCACETQPIVVEGLKSSLQAVEDLEFSGSVDDLTSLFDLVRRAFTRSTAAAAGDPEGNPGGARSAFSRFTSAPPPGADIPCATRIAGISMEHISILIFMEDADAGTFRAEGFSRIEIVIGLTGL